MPAGDREMSYVCGGGRREEALETLQAHCGARHCAGKKIMRVLLSARRIGTLGTWGAALSKRQTDGGDPG